MTNEERRNRKLARLELNATLNANQRVELAMKKLLASHELENSARTISSVKRQTKALMTTAREMMEESFHLKIDAESLVGIDVLTIKQEQLLEEKRFSEILKLNTENTTKDVILF